VKERPYVKCKGYIHSNVLFWIDLRSILYDFIAKIEKLSFVISLQVFRLDSVKMKIAILGARGFVGRNLGRLLISHGHEVTGYVLNSELETKIGFECKSVYKLLDSQIGVEPVYDVTINLAARRATRAQPFSESQVNDFTYEIPKEFILRTASPETLVLNSSTYIQNFGGKTGHTVDSYGVSKEKLSRFLEQESLRHKFKTIDLFFFTLYGEGDRPSHLVPLLLDAAFTGKQISLSPGNQLMNLLYIEDALGNILRCINQNGIVNYQKNYVWAAEYFSVRELVDRIQSSIGREIDCAWGEREYVGHEMMEPWSIPMEQLPGFKAPTLLEDGIKKIWKSILKD
jgi:nucleoside-diphosphate-sugar epimerase